MSRTLKTVGVRLPVRPRFPQCQHPRDEQHFHLFGKEPEKWPPDPCTVTDALHLGQWRPQRLQSRPRPSWKNVLLVKVSPGSRGGWKAPSWVGPGTRLGWLGTSHYKSFGFHYFGAQPQGEAGPHSRKQRESQDKKDPHWGISKPYPLERFHLTFQRFHLKSALNFLI